MPYYIETTTEEDLCRWFAQTPTKETEHKAERLLFSTAEDAMRFGQMHQIDGTVKHTGRTLDTLLLVVVGLIIAAYVLYLWFFGFYDIQRNECEYLVTICQEDKP